MVEVFKTDVHEVAEAKKILSLLHTHFPDSRINFDLDDCDKILRIEGDNIVVSKLKSLVEGQGFLCNTLES